MISAVNNQNLKKQTPVIKIIGGILTAAFMWGSGNVVSRSLLIEGVGEIFLITTRVSIIGTLLLIHYSIFNRDKFDKKLLKEASTTAFSLHFFCWMVFYIFPAVHLRRAGYIIDKLCPCFYYSLVKDTS